MKDLAKFFNILDEVGEIRPLKIGFINDSFIVGSKYLDGNWYLLQKINHKIFQNIYGLQQNINIVTKHLRAKLIQEGEKDIDKDKN